jgi:hypothetical protein
MSGMNNWLARHPLVLGALFVVIALLAFRESVSDAREFRRFADASAVTGEVVAVARKSQLPPRWSATVKWREHGIGAGESTIVIGTQGKNWSTPRYSPGSSVEILLDPQDPDQAVLRRDATTTPPMKRAGFELGTNQFWFGVFFAVAALFAFLFAGRIRRELE